MPKKESNIEDVCRGIHQAAANAYDGAPVEIGLKREKGNPMYDPRIIDGFGVKILGRTLVVTYHSEVKLADVTDDKFEQECEYMLADIVKWLKKEYRSVTNHTLKLKDTKDDIKVSVNDAGGLSYYVLAAKTYTIESMPED